MNCQRNVGQAFSQARMSRRSEALPSFAAPRVCVCAFRRSPQFLIAFCGDSPLNIACVSKKLQSYIAVVCSVVQAMRHDDNI